ncbi:MAG: hypothetical protein CVT83_02720 [Alphaproteobacteria bacterium HGW-Alphaproteobacteria-5]|nr:MAG: hypothetical protein CVT83_02720 [Alphaproteobacteria bacterium HGW-Alphaproteobacteria-5]
MEDLLDIIARSCSRLPPYRSVFAILVKQATGFIVGQTVGNRGCFDAMLSALLLTCGGSLIFFTSFWNRNAPDFHPVAQSPLQGLDSRARSTAPLIGHERGVAPAMIITRYCRANQGHCMMTLSQRLCRRCRSNRSGP